MRPNSKREARLRKKPSVMARKISAAKTRFHTKYFNGWAYDDRDYMVVAHLMGPFEMT